MARSNFISVISQWLRVTLDHCLMNCSITLLRRFLRLMIAFYPDTWHFPKSTDSSAS